jgi:hypothetical protein
MEESVLGRRQALNADRLQDLFPSPGQGISLAESINARGEGGHAGGLDASSSWESACVASSASLFSNGRPSYSTL